MIRVGAFRFAPALLPSLAALPLLGLLLGLGFWQLDRAAQKQSLLDDYQRHARDAAITLDADTRIAASDRYRRVEARGVYDVERQFLLDNRVHQGRPGYEVLTPLRLGDGEVAVLVDRGWLPLGRSRDELPDLRIAEPESERRVSGMIYLPSPDTFVLGEGEARDPGWPKVLQRVRYELHAQQLGYRLLPMVLWLDPAAADGYTRAWQPVVFGPERHRGYAVQWFALAATLFVIYLGFQFRPLHTPPKSPGGPA